MAEKMTKAQRFILTALNDCTAPWWPASPYNKSMLTRIEKMGFAWRRYGHPIGWVITDAGRRALDEASHDR